MLRLFVALELPEDVRDSLAVAMELLRADGIGDGVRWVRPESIHLTLKFLGAVDEARVPTLHTALRLGVRDAAPFALSTDALGAFGGRRNLRVIWAGVGGDTAALAGLAARAETALAPLGFARERPFAGHLTLARVRDETPPEERGRMHALIAATDPPGSLMFQVEQCQLMRSRLGRDGAVYDAIGSYPLEGMPA